MLNVHLFGGMKTSFLWGRQTCHKTVRGRGKAPRPRMLEKGLGDGEAGVGRKETCAAGGEAKGQRCWVQGEAGRLERGDRMQTNHDVLVLL